MACSRSLEINYKFKNMKQKMYWKNGFYDESVTGAVEISADYWQELLNGQSAGKLIVENAKGYPVLADYKPTIDEIRAQKLVELRAYDVSDMVNQFCINGVTGWLNKNTRVGLMNSIAVGKEARREVTSIWLGDTRFVLPIEKATDMLQQIELYALACYDTTQRHIHSINQLETIEEIEAYDFRAGYPLKLNFAG